MLLDFTCTNFKSFKDGFEFRMEPKSRLSELQYSIMSETVANKENKALSVSAIYGPNAAGKTSIINAMSCFRQIVLKGSIEDSESDKTSDHVSAQMKLIPFLFSEKTEPVSFVITFTHQGVKYCYSLSLVIGKYTDDDDERYITNEQLFVNDKMVFSREKDDISYLSLLPIKDSLNVGYLLGESEKHRTAMAQNIKDTSLLLTTDFYSFCSKKVVDDVKEWFTKQFMIVNAANRAVFYPNILNEDKQAVISFPVMNDIAKNAGIIGNGFAYINDPQTQRPKLVSVLKEGPDNEFSGIIADKIESLGTLRLISIMPAILTSLQRGAVLAIDELDASLHPMIVMNLISLYHNNEVNKKHAQLIFNTHNPIYLNNKLLRRDEIRFVERDHETRSSCFYALSDFKTNGEISVRNTSDYMRNYFVNRYGAIEDVDFTDIVLDFLAGEGASNGA